jgi:PleD family two-component response regulator
MSEFTPLTILIADDTDSDRLILESIVKKEGHRVISVCDGQEAISAFIADRPDMVLLDALMPKLDGFDAAKKIKELAGDELIPIIFLTSLTDTQSLVRCLDAGGDDLTPVFRQARSTLILWFTQEINRSQLQRFQRSWSPRLCER